MTPVRFPPKRPDEILDYEIDFAKASPDENVTAARVAVSGVTLVSQSLVGKVVRFRLSGGVAGTTATVTVEVDTVSGQLYETVQTIRIVS